MSLDVIRTIKKCMLSNNRVIRLSLNVENVYFIYLEYNDEQDILERRKLLWNGIYESDANVKFNHYKCECNLL